MIRFFQWGGEPEAFSVTLSGFSLYGLAKKTQKVYHSLEARDENSSESKK
jgi:hypothetical protein